MNISQIVDFSKFRVFNQCNHVGVWTKYSVFDLPGDYQKLIDMGLDPLDFYLVCDKNGNVSAVLSFDNTVVVIPSTLTTEIPATVIAEIAEVRVKRIIARDQVQSQAATEQKEKALDAALDLWLDPKMFTTDNGETISAEKMGEFKRALREQMKAIVSGTSVKGTDRRYFGDIPIRFNEKMAERLANLIAEIEPKKELRIDEPSGATAIEHTQLPEPYATASTGEQIRRLPDSKVYAVTDAAGNVLGGISFDKNTTVSPQYTCSSIEIMYLILNDYNSINADSFLDLAKFPAATDAPDIKDFLKVGECVAVDPYDQAAHDKILDAARAACPKDIQDWLKRSGLVIDFRKHPDTPLDENPNYGREKYRPVEPKYEDGHGRFMWRHSSDTCPEGRHYEFGGLSAKEHGWIRFQNGPVADGVNGTTTEMVVRALIDRLRILDNEHPCYENKVALDLLNATIGVLSMRSDRNQVKVVLDNDTTNATEEIQKILDARLQGRPASWSDIVPEPKIFPPMPPIEKDFKRYLDQYLEHHGLYPTIYDAFFRDLNGKGLALSFKEFEKICRGKFTLPHLSPSEQLMLFFRDHMLAAVPASAQPETDGTLHSAADIYAPASPETPYSWKLLLDVKMKDGVPSVVATTVVDDKAVK